jgi:hypothetical integral membrane protein (TIGR02206 family)
MRSVGVGAFIVKASRRFYGSGCAAMQCRRYTAAVQTFTAWSVLHVAMLAAIAASLAVAVTLRRRSADATARRFERAVGAAYLVLWAATFVWLHRQPDYDPTTDWPLQLCHWAAVAAALALLTQRRTCQTLAYFWGLALCTQALVTPNLTDGPAMWPFWFFWTTHAMAVGVPLYDVLARGYRPGWRDYALASAGAAVYVAIVLPIDLATGWNYGFVGPSRPEVATIVDLLGPWPRRLLFVAAIAAAAMAVAMLPWIGRRDRATRTPAPSQRTRRA